ncbi:MAG: hypothetical protein AVO34_06015 [Firmicutes bacterium ML8_F2]|nr:MAG: hypothetical protein AVO34_06015 [Firmicutes bacterium ML8_F2]
MLDKEFGGVLGCQGVGKQEALSLVTFALQQKGQLIVVFDPFGVDFEVHALGQRNNAGGEAGIGAGGTDIPQKRPVDFQLFDGEFQQIAEQRKAGTEIVDRQDQPQFLKLLQHADGACGAFHQQVFGNFKFQAMGRELYLPQNGFDGLNKIRLSELEGGEVHRDAQGTEAPGLPGLSLQTGGIVLASTFLKLHSHLTQQFVADLMVQGIVDVFESVEVQKQQANPVSIFSTRSMVVVIGRKTATDMGRLVRLS